MGNYNRDNRSRGRSSFGGRDSRRSFGRDRRSDSRNFEMHKVICDECGKECEVPFKPSTDKPIYCSECFEKRGGGRENRNDRGRRDFGGRDRDHRSFGGRDRDSGRDNFRRDEQSSGTELNELKSQLEKLNNKVDQILRTITPRIEQTNGEINFEKEENLISTAIEEQKTAKAAKAKKASSTKKVAATGTKGKAKSTKTKAKSKSAKK